MNSEFYSIDRKLCKKKSFADYADNLRDLREFHLTEATILNTISNNPDVSSASSAGVPAAGAAKRYSSVRKSCLLPMIHHSSLGNGFTASRQLWQLIDQRQVQLAGNKKLRIYGVLDCFSGKRMKKENRVFFSSEAEAIRNGYRCCKNCWCKTRQKKSS